MPVVMVRGLGMESNVRVHTSPATTAPARPIDQAPLAVPRLAVVPADPPLEITGVPTTSALPSWRTMVSCAPAATAPWVVPRLALINCASRAAIAPTESTTCNWPSMITLSPPTVTTAL